MKGPPKYVIYCDGLKPDIHVATQRNAIPGDGKSLRVCVCGDATRRRSLAVAAVLTLSEISKSSCVVSLCVCASATQLASSFTKASVCTKPWLTLV